MIHTLDPIISGLDALATYVHDEAVYTGFYDLVDPEDPRHQASIAGLIASEAHEIIEALRSPRRETAKRIGPDFWHEEEEAADTQLRLFDYCAWRNLRLGEAVRAKLEANRGRGHRFGGKRF